MFQVSVKGQASCILQCAGCVGQRSGDVLVLEAHEHIGGRAAPLHHGPFKGFQQGMGLEMPSQNMQLDDHIKADNLTHQLHKDTSRIF